MARLFFGSTSGGSSQHYGVDISRRRRRLIVWVLSLSVLALLAGCNRKESEREAKQPSGQNNPSGDILGAIHLSPAEMDANGIEIATAIEQDQPEGISVVGRVRARPQAEAEVFSPFPGRLVADPSRLPRMGGHVNKGQMLAEVEQLLTASEGTQFAATAAQLQASVVSAEQEVEFDRRELDRVRDLYTSGGLALKRLQTAEFDLKQAEAKLDGANKAKAQYDALLSQRDAARRRRVEIKAPISGTVLSTDMVPGMQVDPAKTLATVADLSVVWVEASVHESQLPIVGSARYAEITTTADPGRQYRGTLITTSGVMDALNRTASVIFEVENPGGTLRIGMTANAAIVAGGRTRKILTVPASAVLTEEGRLTVYVEVKAGEFRARAIVASYRVGDRIPVTSGLVSGERVVSVGAAILRSEALKGRVPAEADDER